MLPELWSQGADSWFVASTLLLEAQIWCGRGPGAQWPGAQAVEQTLGANPSSPPTYQPCGLGLASAPLCATISVSAEAGVTAVPSAQHF